jgi:hypothetical protein
MMVAPRDTLLPRTREQQELRRGLRFLEAGNGDNAGGRACVAPDPYTSELLLVSETGATSFPCPCCRVTLRIGLGDDGEPLKHMRNVHRELGVVERLHVLAEIYPLWSARRYDCLPVSSPDTSEPEVMGRGASRISVAYIAEDGATVRKQLDLVSRMKIVGVWLSRSGGAYHHIRARGHIAKMVARSIAPKCRALLLLGAAKEAKEVLKSFILSTLWYGMSAFALNEDEQRRIGETAYYVAGRCLGEDDDGTQEEQRRWAAAAGLRIPMDIVLGMQLKTWAKLRRDSAAFVAEVHVAAVSGRRGEDVPCYDEKLGSLVRVFSSERKVDPGNKLGWNKEVSRYFQEE